MDYNAKYLKYKTKYLNLKYEQMGRGCMLKETKLNKLYYECFNINNYTKNDDTIITNKIKQYNDYSTRNKCEYPVINYTTPEEKQAFHQNLDIFIEKIKKVTKNMISNQEENDMQHQ
jgi:hypothetical protein